jgi:hypothetical protein
MDPNHLIYGELVGSKNAAAECIQFEAVSHNLHIPALLYEGTVAVTQN